MKKLKDYTGVKINSLTAIKFHERIKSKTFWLFKCDCGVEKIINTSHFCDGKTKSCGCSRTKYKLDQKNNSRLYYSVFSNYKFSANKRGYVFEIDYNYFKKLISDKCFYCGSINSNKISEKGRSKYNNDKYILYYNGIDRMDNSLGYTIENCVSCCSICNMAKKSMPFDKFIYWINTLIKNNK